MQETAFREVASIWFEPSPGDAVGPVLVLTIDAADKASTEPFRAALTDLSGAVIGEIEFESVAVFRGQAHFAAKRLHPVRDQGQPLALQGSQPSALRLAGP